MILFFCLKGKKCTLRAEEGQREEMYTHGAFWVTVEYSVSLVLLLLVCVSQVLL